MYFIDNVVDIFSYIIYRVKMMADIIINNSLVTCVYLITLFVDVFSQIKHRVNIDHVSSVFAISDDSVILSSS